MNGDQTTPTSAEVKITWAHRFRHVFYSTGARKLGLYVSVIGAFLALSWFVNPEIPADARLNWWFRIWSVVLFFTPILFGLWLRKVVDPVRDHLRDGPIPFERDGLCFVIYLKQEGPLARMTLDYQNRFSTPRVAQVFVGPTQKAFANLEGLPVFKFEFTAGGAGRGRMSFGCCFPQRFHGKRVLWDVAAKVVQPRGPGFMLIGRRGMPVADHLIGVGEEAVKALTGAFVSLTGVQGHRAGPGRAELLIPGGTGSGPNTPFDLRVEAA